ncbi:MAG: polysaccharide pyruvyl transferase CsaB [Cellulosilyticaceae bacterium]
MDSKKSVVISGYYGFDNIGDEAVLYAIIEALRAQVKDVEITVLSNMPEKTKALYQVGAINRWKIKEINKAIQNCDVLISGGGSLLQDVTSSKTIPYYLFIVKMAQFYKKKVVFYSQGIGPVNKPWSKCLMKYVCNKVDHIFVREEVSQKTLEQLGVHKSPVTVAIDPVLGLSCKQEIKEKVAQKLEGQKTVGIYLRPWQNDEAVVEALLPIVNHLTEHGYKVYGVPMYYKEDLKIAQMLSQKTNGKVNVIDHELSIEETIAYTACFEFVIGMRLHSLIMAAAVGTPMLALSYDPKVTDFTKEIGVDYCIGVEAITSELLQIEVERLVGNLTEEKRHVQVAYKAKLEKVMLPAVHIANLLGGNNEGNN